MAPPPDPVPDSFVRRWVARVAGGRLTPRGLRIATLGAALAMGLVLVGMLVMVQVSSTPQFCGTCHIMKPYYESWRNSKHNRIACVECHISPGITAEIRKKYEALSMVVKYFTATYSTNPWAEVDDAACLRCHERRLLEGKESLGGVVFDHAPHLTETRRGLRLRCTSCHSQIVQGSHIAVTSSTCALCHFKGGLQQETARCRTCHEVPGRITTAGGVAFDHGQVSRLDMDCALCHAGVVRGEGGVPKERCVTCHNQAERLSRIGDPDFLHRMHVTEHKVDCMNCHLQIEHGKLPRAEAGLEMAAGACASCHGSGHSPQRDLYSGVGGRGVPPMPSPMFSAGVTCQGCHNPDLVPEGARADADRGGGPSAMAVAHPPLGAPAPSAPGEAPPLRTVRAGPVACMSCHGPGYLRIYESWRSAAASRASALRAQLDRTAPAMGVVPPAVWEDARHNYLLVERGRGIHNINFAFALLEKSHEQMNEARRRLGIEPLPRPWSSPAAGARDCVTCHAGIEDQRGRFADRDFAHRPHLEGGRLPCATCHRPHAERAPGEIVRFGATGCLPCHHRATAVEAAACAKCHADVTKRTIPSFRGAFSHQAHLDAGLECASCHAAGAADPRPAHEVCAQCHEGS